MEGMAPAPMGDSGGGSESSIPGDTSPETTEDRTEERSTESTNAEASSNSSSESESDDAPKKEPAKAKGSDKKEPAKEKAPPRKYKYKVDKTESELTRDEVLDQIRERYGEELDANPDGVMSAFQLSKFAHGKLGRAQQESARFQALEEGFKTDPAGTLTKLLGPEKANAYAEQLLREQVRQSQLTPDAREEEAVKQRLAQYKAEEQQVHQRKLQQRTGQAAAAIKHHVTQGLDTNKVPEAFRGIVTQEVVRQLQQQDRSGARIGAGDIKRIVGEVAKGTTEAFGTHFDGLDDAGLLQRLGPRMGALSRAYAASLQPTAAPPPPAPPPRKAPRASAGSQSFNMSAIRDLVTDQGMSFGEAKEHLAKLMG